jgi:hypothetical protein
MIDCRSVVIAVILVGLVALLEESAGAEIGQIKNVARQVFLFRNNVEHPAKAGDLIEQADVVTTQSSSPGSSIAWN